MGPAPRSARVPFSAGGTIPCSLHFRGPAECQVHDTQGDSRDYDSIPRGFIRCRQTRDSFSHFATIEPCFSLARARARIERGAKNVFASLLLRNNISKYAIDSRII